MIKFFRQSYLVQYICLALLLLALWVPAFMPSQVTLPPAAPVSPFYYLVTGVLDFSPYATLILAFLLIMFEALFFNSILVKNGIIPQVSTMGAFAFILMMSLTLSQTTFFPFALASLFLLMLIHTLFQLYMTDNPEIHLFNAGLCLALATMCYFQCIILIVWVFIALGVLRNGSFRLQLIPVLGLLTPYFFLFSGYYLFGDFSGQLHQYADFFTSFSLSVKDFDLSRILLMAALVVGLFIPLLGGGNFSFEKATGVRLKMSMIYILLLFALFLVFTGGDPLCHGLLFIVLSFVLAFDLSYMNKVKWAEVFLALFVLLVFADHYYFRLL